MWARLMRADNAFQSLRPLTYISLIGLAPFSLASEREVRTSTLSLVAAGLHFHFFVLCFILSHAEGGSIIEYFYQTNITKLGDATLSLTGITVMLTIFGFAIFRRKHLVSIIQNNIFVDEILIRLDIKLDYWRILRYSFVISLGMLLFNVIYLCFSYGLLRSAFIKPSFVVFTTFALPHINISIMVFKFLCITHLTKSRFALLNEILQDILNSHIEERNSRDLSPMHSHSNGYAMRCSTSRRYSVVSIMRQRPSYSIKQVANIHNLLCDICNTIEEYFSYPLLAIIAISFLFILFDNFYILEAMLVPKRLDVFETDEFFAFFFAQLLWYVIIIFLIVEGSSVTIKESKIIASLVHKILNITDDAELRDRLFRLSLQLSHRQVRFTAAGLFNLDRTLIFTITGAAACYLMILIQFGSSNHNMKYLTFGNSTGH